MGENIDTVTGPAVFGITNTIYNSLKLRLTANPCERIAPEANVLMLYLASQCLQGLI